MKRKPRNGEIEKERWGNEKLLGWRRDGTWIANWGSLWEKQGHFKKIHETSKCSSKFKLAFSYFQEQGVLCSLLLCVIACAIKNESSLSFYLSCPSRSLLLLSDVSVSYSTCLHNACYLAAEVVWRGALGSVILHPFCLLGTTWS